MKKLISSIMLGAMLLTVPSCTVLTGDQTSDIHRMVYLSFSDLWIAAKTSYDGYCEEVVRGNISTEDERDIDEAWNKFRVAFKISFSTASQDWTQFPPDNVQKLGEDLRILILSL